MVKKQDIAFPDQVITESHLVEEMERSYIEYAMSVIVGRALPDVRDGLKPVHRRILYTMYKRADFAGTDGALRIWGASAKNQVFTVQEDTLATDENARYTLNGAGEKAQFVADHSDVLAKNGYVHELSAWLPSMPSAA